MTKSIEICDVGPIQRLVIELPESGLCVLRGPNGSGKTLSLQAVQSLLGSGRPVSRDGSLGAQVSGLGVRLTVGRRSAKSGELEVHTLEGEDPSLLVDPGLKSADAADAERIRALLRLSGAKVDVAAFASLLGSDDQLREFCRPSSLETRDVPAMAAAIKRDLEAAARKREQEAENLLAKADGMRTALKSMEGTVGQLRLMQTSAEAARAAHTEAVKKHSALEATRDQNARILRAAAEARAALQELGDDASAVDDTAEQRCSERAETLRAALGGLGDAGKPGAVARARGAVEGKRALVEQLRIELAKAEQEHAAAVDEVEKQEKATAERARLEQELAEVERERRTLKERAALRRTVRESEGVVEITEAELEAHVARVRATQAEADAWAVRERTEGQREEIARLEAQGRVAEGEGRALREAAKGTERVVLEAVRAVCGDDMEIHDGRLFVRTTDRGLEPFSELSQGERWRKALDIAVKAVGSNGLLVVRQEAYESLDPVNRRDVAAYARQLGVVILTAEADDGEIRAEVA